MARARRIDGSVSLFSTAKNIATFAHDMCSRFCPPAERQIPSTSVRAGEIKVCNRWVAHSHSLTSLQRAASWELCISVSCHALVYSLKGMRLRSRVYNFIAPSYTIVFL